MDILGIILIGYWLILLLFGGSDPFGLSSNIARTIDIAILGENHLWRGTGIPFDPEGLLSTIPALLQCFIGFSIGNLYKKFRTKCPCKNYTNTRCGIAAVGGSGIHLSINKQLWTRPMSYILVDCILFLSCLIWLIDIRGYKNLSWPFMIFGPILFLFLLVLAYGLKLF
ncbi:MAG: hypothetical protein CM1200mP10_08230 [Candidatus Neomarinimicrobiota bacterium]|nr:MAG: hypothetical protein CM1200mP10_08230 [Candidatus Neomarinimicrobiota bacterium]